MKRSLLILVVAAAALAGFVAGRFNRYERGPGAQEASVSVRATKDPGRQVDADAPGGESGSWLGSQAAICPRGGEAAWVASSIRRTMLGDDYLRTVMEFAMIRREQFPLVVDEWQKQRANLKVEGDPDDTDMVDLLERVLMTCWAESDPATALAWFEQSPEHLKNQGMIGAVFKGLAPSGLDAATVALGKLEGGARSSAVGALTIGLAAIDPERALLFALSINDRGAEKAAGAAAQRLAATNPARAAELAGALAGTAAGSHALKEVAKSWGERDPATAEVWGRSWDGPGRMEFLETVLRDAVEKDPDRVAADLPDLIAGSGTKSPSDLKGLSGLAGNVAGELLKTRSIEEMVTWAAQLPEGPARAGAQGRIAAAWVSRDHVAASAWIAQLPAGPDRDGAVVPLILKIKDAEPADALAWAGTLAAPDTRNRWQRDILENWEKHAPEAAGAARAALAQAQPVQ